MNPSEILAKWLPSIVILDSRAGDVRSWFTFISVLRADHSQAKLSTIFWEEKSFSSLGNLQQYRGIFTKKLLIMFYVNLHSQEMRNDCCWPWPDLRPHSRDQHSHRDESERCFLAYEWILLFEYKEMEMRHPNWCSEVVFIRKSQHPLYVWIWKVK